MERVDGTEFYIEPLPFPDPLKGLKPNQRRECEWCGKIRWVKNLVAAWSPYKTSPIVVCKDHRLLWY